MEIEEAPPPVKSHTPLFSEEANIYTVDTVEGLLCTHEVRGRHQSSLLALWKERTKLHGEWKNGPMHCSYEWSFEWSSIG